MEIGEVTGIYHSLIGLQIQSPQIYSRIKGSKEGRPSKKL